MALRIEGMKIRPLQDRVIIKRIEEEEKTKGAIRPTVCKTGASWMGERNVTLALALVLTANAISASGCSIHESFYREMGGIIGGIGMIDDAEMLMKNSDPSIYLRQQQPRGATKKLPQISRSE
jgi:Chaperonin 10 Kd subunit